MPTFFSADGTAPVGRVVQCLDDHTQGTMKFVELLAPAGLQFSTHRSIFTRLTVSHQCNYQFLHTIGNEIYIYVFGDRIGQIQLSGLSFTSDCQSGSDGQHGFEKVLQWYEQYRVAARRDPITIMIGQTAIRGFAVALSGDVVDPGTRMMQWGLTLMVLPKKGDG
jgi:hypothetical protein